MKTMQDIYLEKLAEEPTKKEVVEVLKKHEERETPAQEAEESDKEQKVEEAAGIHEKDAAEKRKKKKKKKHPPQEVIMFHGHYAAPSCKHHKVLHSIAKKHGITPRVVDVEKDTKETTKHNVRGVPHVVFQKDGKTVGQYSGDRPESHVNAFFRSHVESPEAAGAEAPAAPPAAPTA